MSAIDTSSLSTGTTSTYNPQNFDTISGSINFTGLGSGTDFTKVVDQLVQIESINKMRMETWKATWEAKMESMRSLNQRLDAIEEAAGALDTKNEFLSLKASTSDSNVVTAVGTSSATPGAYNVVVGSNVKNIITSSGVAATTTTVATNLPAGTSVPLVLKINGTTYTTSNLDNTTTLADLKSAIETAVGSAATVEIVNDGTSKNPYHLQITSATGGSDGRVEIVKNPTDLSLDIRNTALNRYDSAWTGTTTVDTAGQFTGDSATADVYVYTFTISTGGGSATVGSNAFTINWTASAGGGSGSISVPADYTPGDLLEVEKGIYIKLSSGTVNDTEKFYVNGYANNIDDAEVDTWTGPAITTSGNYLGTVNKTYSFSVVSGGDLDTGEARVLRWTDSLGRTGTVSVTDSGTAYEVEQGVKIAFASGTALPTGETFNINVFAANKQQGQDAGLAQATKVVHNGFPDDTTTAVTSSSATFSYTYGGKSVSISVPAGTTLSQLVNLINNDEDNPGVSASILNDGQGLPTSYKLVLTGKNSGAAYQITAVSHNFSSSAFSSTGEIGGGFTRAQFATNAMVKIDGFPSDADEYLQRSSNTIGDVIEGVAIDLHGAGSATITISTDVDAIISKIEAFINAVNYAQDFIREETKFDPKGKDTGILIGNYAYNLLKSTIDSILNSSISGLTQDNNDGYTALSQIGIKTDPDQDGRWVIDSLTLRNALSDDTDAVANLFIHNTSKGTKGVAKKMYDEMDTQTNAETGILNVLIKNYTGIVENIDKKIAYEEKRLETYRKHQMERFARLETLLSKLDSQSKAIENQVKSLPKPAGT